MDHPFAASAMRWKTTLIRGLEAAALAVVFIGIALTFNGLVLDVTYQRARVLEVIQVPGQDATERLVLVDLGHRHFPLRTADRLLHIDKGQLACVSQRHILLRRWKRYRLELPGYCRAIPQAFTARPDVSLPDPVSGVQVPVNLRRSCPTPTHTETEALLCAN